MVSCDRSEKLLWNSCELHYKIFCFLGTARVYNAVTQHCITKLEGHEGEISKVDGSTYILVNNRSEIILVNTNFDPDHAKLLHGVTKKPRHIL
jgi:hypothetical protein